MTLDRLRASLADRYTIERELGHGGMATVYLAHDLKHDRDVAVKVLKPELGSMLGVERFLAEIKVTAHLQHPNILPLFDSGEADGLLFYVMPFVAGESLRARIEREKQLPVDDAVDIACAIARALDYAHARGVIHRDLKPENVLLQDGQPLLADFGIALAVARAGGSRMTDSGLSLGTPQYMSPEQATADRTIDGRSDTYALGAVTYEMLTGEPPHTGSTAQAIVARIMTEEPRPVRASRASVPERVDRAIHKALAKLPADRWGTAKEFAEALTGARPVDVAVARRRAAPASRAAHIRELVAWVLALAGIGVAGYLATRSSTPPATVRFAVELPDSMLVLTEASRSIALSNDGSQLAILVESPGRLGIYVRRMDDTVAHLIRGTDDATDLGGFSPDGQSVLFSVDSVLKKVPVGGGTPQIVAEPGGSARWSDRMEVVYSNGGAIWVASGDGARRHQIDHAGTAQPHPAYDDPDPLPGGAYALITIGRSNLDSSRIGVISLRDGRVADLGIVGMNPRYVAPGTLVFARNGGHVLEAPFSLRTRRVTGPASPVLERVDQAVHGSIAFTVAQNGTMAYSTGTGSATLVAMYRVGLDGREQRLPGQLQRFKEPRLSPDGRRVMATILPGGQAATRSGLWLFDIAASTLTLLQADSVLMHGEWSGDGSHVVYVRQQGRDSQLLVSRPWDGSGAATILAQGGRNAFQAISLGPPHGLSAIAGPTSILFAPTDSLGVMRPLGATPTRGASPRISPNGQLLAYTSDETGQDEVYVEQIPGPGRRVTVSTGGGADPLWSRDGATLFYHGPTRIMSAAVRDRPALEITRRDSLFADSYFPGYDVFPNGDLLMVRPPTPSKVFVIVNWPQLARARSGAAPGPD